MITKYYKIIYKKDIVTLTLAFYLNHKDQPRYA